MCPGPGLPRRPWGRPGARPRPRPDALRPAAAGHRPARAEDAGCRPWSRDPSLGGRRRHWFDARLTARFRFRPLDGLTLDVRTDMLRHRGPEQRPREVPRGAADSNTVRVLTPCQLPRYRLLGWAGGSRECRSESVVGRDLVAYPNHAGCGYPVERRLRTPVGVPLADRSEGLDMSTSRPSRMRLASSTADLLAVAVVVCDREGAARYANRAWTLMTGQVFPQWLGLGWSAVLDPIGRQATVEGLMSCVGRGDAYEGEWSVGASPGGARTLLAKAVPDVGHGEVAGFVVTIDDVTAQRAHTEHLMYLATHDPLTGLYNRPQFLEFVRHAAGRQRRQQRCGALLFIDVDNLKRTNDRLGHDAGDRLLRTVAARVSGAVRPADVVARYGGDEFTVLCED